MENSSMYIKKIQKVKYDWYLIDKKRLNQVIKIQ